MQNILVPTDFSNNAFHALSYAAELFKNEECSFFLLNVLMEKKGFKGKQIPNISEEFSKKLQEDSNVRLERLLSRIKKKKDNPKHTYRLLFKKNELIKVINSLIDELGIDLIVMGNKGKRSSIPIFLGSTTTKTLHAVKKCPVLAVPKSAGFSRPKEFAFATDLKKPFNSATIGSLRYLALHCGAVIRIVHIAEEEPLDEFSQSNLDALLAYLVPIVQSVRQMPNFISKTKIIQIFLEESGIDILAMVNNEHSPLEKMLREPIIEKMVLNIDIPFFVIPETP